MKNKFIKLKNWLSFPFNFLFNLYFLIALLPLYVKIKYQSVAIVMTMINMVIFSFLVLFLFFLGMEAAFGVNPDDKYAYITQDPRVIFNRAYGLGLVALSIFYFYAIEKGAWDKKGMLASLKE